MSRRVLAFGDDYGLPLLLRHLPTDRLAGVVAASIRPQQHVALRELAARAGAPFYLQPRRDDADYARFLAEVRALAPDFIIVNSYSMRLWPDLLAAAGGRGINVHGGLLPQYRGANPVQWAMINDEREAGVTMHCLNEGIDEGDILSQRRVAIRFEDTWRDVQARIAEATDRLLAEDLTGALENQRARQPQDCARARYHRRRRAEDGRIDWAGTALQVYNLIRALVKPHPGAFYESARGKVTIDEYMTISEVCALKHRVAGIPGIERRDMRFAPLDAENSRLFLEVLERDATRRSARLCGLTPADLPGAGAEKLHARNDLAIFLASPPGGGKPLGFAALKDIDWTSRSARIAASMDSASSEASVAAHLAGPLKREFGLARIEA